MTTGSKITPEEAKALYDTMPAGTSLRDLARRLGTTHNTLSRWQRNNWTRQKTGGDMKARTIAGAMEKVSTAAAVLTRDKKRPLKDVTEGINRLKFTQDVAALGAAMDDELLRQGARRALITTCAIFDEIQRQGKVLIKNKPRELGHLLVSCGTAINAAHKAWEQILSIRERAMKTVNSGPIAPTPTADEMDDDDPLKDAFGEFERAANAARATKQ